MKKRLSFFSLLFFTLSFSTCFAAGTISSFTVSDTSAFSGKLVSLSWSGVDVTGYNLFITCNTGVKIKSESNATYPCDTKVSTSGATTDTLGFYLVNISGSNKTVIFSLYPKSSDGSENTSAVQSQSVTISPAPVVISSVAASATTTTSGLPINISWSSSDLDGVNIILNCKDGVTFFSSENSAQLPCGTLAFSDKLAGTGNVNLYFKNTNNDPVSVTAKVLPYIGGGMYDSTHSEVVNFDVTSDKVLPFQILSFSPSQPKVASGDTLTLLWSTKYTNGVNLKVDCDDSLSFSLATTTAGQSIQCNSLFSNTYFTPNSSIEVVINNSSKDTKTAYITLLAQLPTGGFDGVNIRKIPVQVAPKGETVIYTGIINTNSLSQTSVSSNTTSSSVKKIISPRKKFTKILSFGVKSDDVSALQEFLSKNGYYPEGIITGYMGALTTKAVQRFQEQNGVVKAGGVGYGNVGPATRAKLNSL